MIGLRPTMPDKSPSDNPPSQRGVGRNDKDIRFLGELRRLDVKPGDRFVLMIDDPVPFEVAERLRASWRAFMGGDEHKLLVLDSGMKIGVIGEAKD